MNKTSVCEYLVISRGNGTGVCRRRRSSARLTRSTSGTSGSWPKAGSKRASAPAREGKIVSRHAITDGPYPETKEVIGGYWFILAASLEEAAQLATGNPCLACGLVCEIRPLDLARASAFAVTSETPPIRRTGRDVVRCCGRSSPQHDPGQP